MIGSDSGLRYKQPSAIAPPAAKPAQKFAGFRPLAVNDKALGDLENNQMAAGAGAGRAALTSMDRAGVSRGKGQQYAADLAEASSQSDAQAAVNKSRQDAGMADSAANRAYSNTLERERTGNSGLLEGLRNSAAMEQLSKRGMSQNIYEAIRRGQFGLDQIGLDYSPLLQSLFS
jgi:hypothetical protein